MSRLDRGLELVWAIRRFEVIDVAFGCRRWSADDRARILEETFVPGAVCVDGGPASMGDSKAAVHVAARGPHRDDHRVRARGEGRFCSSREVRRAKVGRDVVGAALGEDLPLTRRCVTPEASHHDLEFDAPTCGRTSQPWRAAIVQPWKQRSVEGRSTA